MGACMREEVACRISEVFQSPQHSGSHAKIQTENPDKAAANKTLHLAPSNKG
jgi:hypothetical protein